MDEHKICFVMCVNDDAYAAEAVWYIRRLKIPDGYCVEWQCVKGAVSMTAGYNEAMKNSDARYKSIFTSGCDDSGTGFYRKDAAYFPGSLDRDVWDGWFEKTS